MSVASPLTLCVAIKGSDMQASFWVIFGLVALTGVAFELFRSICKRAVDAKLESAASCLIDEEDVQQMLTEVRLIGDPAMLDKANFVASMARLRIESAKSSF